VRAFVLGLAVLALVVVSGRPLLSQNHSGGPVPAEAGDGAQLSSERSVAPPQQVAPDGERKRTQQLRGLVGLVLLTLIIIAFLLFLMVLTARWTRLQGPKHEARQTTSLEDLWWKVEGKPASDEEIARMLSEDTDKEKPEGGEPKKS
jgi:hypothetical protein